MRWLQARGIAVEPSAPDTQAQNGGAERSGGVNKEKARAMRLDANLLWELWPEVTRAAVYLYNRTPNYVNQWKTPYEVFFTHVSQTNGIITPKKPRLAHLKAYGCKAFAITDDTHRGKSRLQRLDPKAWIGYLVGYQASTIYRIWIPSLAKVISTRDVIFDENTIFDGKVEDLMDSLMHSTLSEIAAYVRTIELPPLIPDTGTESFHEDDTINTTEEINESEDPPGYYMGRKIQEHYPTPPATPPPVALLAQLMSGTAETTPEIQSSKTVPWAAAFMAGTEAGNIGDHNGSAIDKAQLRRLLAKGVKIYQSQLPEPPTARSNLDEHPMGELFKEAQRAHLDSHKITNSWVEVPYKAVKAGGHQILDCMWVFTYKFNQENQFLKCKARLVVRGDQQRNITSQDTYAATLTGRSFRLFMAIAAKYDLEVKQFDVTNAFVHARLDRDVYMRMPHGYQKPGTILKLQKALYGLRISPALWQRDFTATLTKLGFQTVPHEPCCMIKDSTLIFFYVDDFNIAYDQNQRHLASTLVEDLKKTYSMTGGDDIQWFLGIEVRRDRGNRLIHLSQSAYCEKISRLAEDRTVRHDTPIGSAELKPRDGLATPPEINKYQRKIGSLLYAAVNTRPDIAFATSRLARFLSNPSQEHQRAADRVLLYLEETKYLALQLRSGNSMQVASDASFADNTLDRKSSQGYTIKLFGGLIAWRASKQDTVTTSTTEAELLALSQVAKEAIFTSRLIKELKIDLPDQIEIQCDNQQTIRLVTQEISRLQTKLRHVDIHNHWLRQEVASGRIKVTYTQLAEMTADGLTKALPVNQWQRFLTQLGLIESRTQEATRRVALLEIQDQIERLAI
ncbi:hypothetical protein ACJQWK_04811 [Exserohilum turcicum]